MWRGLCRSLRATVDLLLPAVCIYCGNHLDTNDNSQLCDDCLSAISPVPHGSCSCCVHPFISASSSHLCGSCLKKPPYFSKVYAGCLFQGVSKEMIHRLKYRNQVILAESLSHIAINAFQKELTDYQPNLIIPVPLHLRKLRKRTYNQAIEIARPISRHLETPLDNKVLVRHKNTMPQQGLTADARRTNLRKAFFVMNSVKDKKILLADDVMTTGETVRACSKALVKAGAKEVRVVVIARA